MTPTAVR